MGGVASVGGKPRIHCAMEDRSSEHSYNSIFWYSTLREVLGALWYCVCIAQVMVATVLGSGEGGSVGVCVWVAGRLRDRQVTSGKLQLLVQTLGTSAS